MNSRRVRKESKFMRYMKGPLGPLQVLAGAGNLCVQSLAAAGGGGGNISYGNAMGCPTPQSPTPLSRSFGGAAAADSSELRITVVRIDAGKVEAELHRSKCPSPQENVAFLGRIDEEKAFDFGDEDDQVGLMGGPDSYMKSGSWASISRKTMLA